MAFCTKCGAELAEDTRFCPNCGQEKGATVQSNLEQDAKENKVYGILAYLGILLLVTIFAAPKNSAYARFHANQGLVLLIADAICTVLGAMEGLLGILGGLVGGVLGVAILVLAIMGIVSAAKGEMKELPLIGQIKILK